MLQEGDFVREDCPMCKGKNTFTARKEMGELKWNCYKLDCNFFGVSTVGMTALEIRSKLSNDRFDDQKNTGLQPLILPEYVVSYHPSNTLMLDFLRKWFTHPDIKLFEPLYFDVKDIRCVFPIYKDGVMVDAIGRSLKGSDPKWLRYSDQAHVSSYCIDTQPEISKTVVLVEDVISAMKVATVFEGITCMAILGTSLTAEHIEELDGFERIVIALDPDAQKKTLSYKREIEAWTGLETSALLIKDDLKYMENDDWLSLKELLNEDL